MIDTAVRAALVATVGDRHVHADPATRRELSADHSWMSPILRRDLAGMLADLIVQPGDVDELARVLELAHADAVPVTMRGRGTGNYGQAVPLHGGLVIDCSRLAGVRDVGDGWIAAEAGATFVRLEAAARRTGQELAMFPTTTGSSLAGFVCGGAGGIGSLENGFLWDGFVTALDVAPCAPDARPVTFTGAESVAPFLHAYGTTGVVTAATVKLVPARRWVALLASFAAWEDALAAAWELADRDPLPRGVSVDEPALVDLLPPDAAMPAGRASLRTIVRDDDADGVAAVVRSSGGRVEAVRPDATGQLVTLAYNHVTLRALRARPELCHLQVAGPVLASDAGAVRATLPGAMLHVDCHRPGGQPQLGGLVLSEFRDAATLRRGAAELVALGAQVVDPHTYLLGGHGGLDRLHAQAAAFDPAGLLNPGKLPPREPTAPEPETGDER